MVAGSCVVMLTFPKVSSPARVGSRSPMCWWLGLAPATLELWFDSQMRGTMGNRRTLC